MKRLNNQFWRAPGNKRVFDAPLQYIVPIQVNKTVNNICNFFSYYALEYFFNNKEKKIKYNETTRKILFNYILDKMPFDYETKTTNSHLVKSLVFYKLLQVYEEEDKKYIRITFDGIDFFSNWKEYIQTNEPKLNYKLIDIFCRLLLEVKYPSNALYDTTINLHLYPFRILFVLLENKKTLSVDFIKNKLIDIVSYHDFIEYFENDIIVSSDNHSLNELKDNARDKFKAWCIQSFVAMGLLLNDGKNITLNPEYENIINKYLSSIDINHNLFYEANENIIIKPSKEKNARSAIVKKYVLGTAKECYFKNKVFSVFNNGEQFYIHHDTFRKRDNSIYLEGHHILPFSAADLYCSQNGKNVDSPENVIPLCATCHRLLTFGTSEQISSYTDELLNYLTMNNWTFVTKERLLDFYYIDVEKI
ncbi:HNH endonuclease signature motif containing protein [Mycoplasma seminis]|uniref:HNH endonuclease signature motif containing protein n=1 Tax=Mycoplasma seminis TaxID=512749 RepID=A0ABY9H9S8_9MOLU|nr:HNH endonuclease signature motif containing protein [Mycoplasma seminis]WLP85342.1 HNH endonuclease signature motif containing protein [Mycoplasma seminis]